MTKLTKTVKREVEESFDHKGRAIVVELSPFLITFSEKGTRAKYSAPIKWLMEKTIERDAHNKLTQTRGPRNGSTVTRGLLSIGRR